MHYFLPKKVSLSHEANRTFTCDCIYSHTLALILPIKNIFFFCTLQYAIYFKHRKTSSLKAFDLNMLPRMANVVLYVLLPPAAYPMHHPLPLKVILMRCSRGKTVFFVLQEYWCTVSWAALVACMAISEPIPLWIATFRKQIWYLHSFICNKYISKIPVL